MAAPGFKPKTPESETHTVFALFCSFLQLNRRLTWDKRRIIHKGREAGTWLLSGNLSSWREAESQESRTRNHLMRVKASQVREFEKSFEISIVANMREHSLRVIKMTTEDTAKVRENKFVSDCIFLVCASLSEISWIEVGKVAWWITR